MLFTVSLLCLLATFSLATHCWNETVHTSELWLPQMTCVTLNFSLLIILKWREFSHRLVQFHSWIFQITANPHFSIFSRIPVSSCVRSTSSTVCMCWSSLPFVTISMSSISFLLLHGVVVLFFLSHAASTDSCLISRFLSWISCLLIPTSYVTANRNATWRPSFG